MARLPQWPKRTWFALVLLFEVLLFVLGLGLGALWAWSRRRPPAMLLASTAQLAPEGRQSDGVRVYLVHPLHKLGDRLAGPAPGP